MDAPDLDSGFIDVPLVSTIVPTVPVAGTSYLYAIRAFNNTDNEITLNLIDTATAIILQTKPVAPKEVYKEDLAFMPTVGLKWSASASGLISKIWGYTRWPL